MNQLILRIFVSFGVLLLSFPIVSAGSFGFQPTPPKPAVTTTQGSNTSTVKAPGPFDELLAEGFMRLQNGQPLEAIIVFNKVLETDKHNGRAMVGIALSHGSQGQWVLACNELEDAALWNPGNEYALLTYLDCSSQLHTLYRSLPIARRLCSTNDKGTAALCRKVAVLLVERDYWSAQWFAERAHLLNPKAFPSESVSPKPLKVITKKKFSKSSGQDNYSIDENTIPGDYGPNNYPNLPNYWGNNNYGSSPNPYYQPNGYYQGFGYGTPFNQQYGNPQMNGMGYPNYGNQQNGPVYLGNGLTLYPSNNDAFVLK